MHAKVKRALEWATVRALGAAGAMLALAVAGSLDAHAQLRGLTGAGGGIAGGAGIGGAGIGGGLPGAPGVGGGAIPGGGADLAPTLDNSVTFGLSFPSNLGSAPVPTTAVPALTGTASRLGTGLTNTIANPTGTLSGVGQRAQAAGSVAPRRSGVPPAGERRYVPSEVVVSLLSRLTAGALDAVAARHRLTHIESYQIGLTATTIHRWRITDARSVSDVIRALENDTGVAAAQPNYRFTLQQSAGTPSTDIEAMQYALAKLHVPRAHRLSTGEQVLVGVIDSGIDTTHPDIAGTVAASFDAVAAQEGPDGHGTAMAGAIIAHAQLKGVAPAARLLAVRAFGGSGESREGTTMAIAQGIDWAVAHGARVINMSFAGPNDPGLARVLAAAKQKGVVLVAAAGNAGPKSPPLYPAADPNVVAVTATDADDKLLAVAVRGRYIAIAAPGVDILGPAPGGGYQMSTGTSVAAAHVSGIAALLCARKRGITPDAVRKALTASAIDLGPKGRDDGFGAGLADAYGAMQALPAASATAHKRPENISAAH